jgi:transmembrane sensor
MESEDYIKKWLDGTLTEDEKNTEEFKRLEKISNSLVSFKAPEYNAEVEYERLQLRLKATAKPARGKVVAMNWLSPILKIAAVLVLLVGSYFFFRTAPPTVINTLAAEHKELTLPDSSYLSLSALSQVTFNKGTWGKDRRIRLSGEAFFKVTKGPTFQVETSMGTVTVLGTEFTIKNRNDYFEVICFEGSVKVQSGKDEVKLAPNQMFRLIDGVVATNKTEANKSLTWNKHESSFSSVPFRFVIEDIERQYNIKVTSKEVDLEQLFTGSFTHQDITLALLSITIPLNITYKIADDKNIILLGDSK